MTTSRMWAIASSIAALALVVTVGHPASATGFGSQNSTRALDIQQCKPMIQALGPGGWPHTVQISFAPLPDRVPTAGEVHVTAVFVDFPDAPARIAAQSYFEQFVPQGLKIIEDLSYGKVRFSIDGPHGWFRMPRASGDYGYFRGMDGEAHRGLITDAVKVSDSAVDYSRTEAFIIVMPPTVSDPGFSVSPAFVADSNFGVPADGNVLMNGTTIGTDWADQRPLVVAHEILHTMGLVDLYKMDSTPPLNLDTGEFVGTYSMMSVYGETPPPLFGWERWVRGWIRDDQVSCLGQGVHDVALDSILLPSRGEAMAVVPLGGTRYLAMEGRGSIGAQRLKRQGVLPYVVDPSIPTGEGPIRVPQGAPGQPRDPMPVGAAMAIEGIGVEVRSAPKGSFTIRIHSPAPAPTFPGAPSGVKVMPSLTGSTVVWAAPLRTGWTSITGYEFRWDKGTWQATTGLSTVVPVSAGKRPRTFHIRALNDVGPGASVSIRIPAR